MADLAARVGIDVNRLERTIVRINTIESTSPLATGDNTDNASLPAVLVPSEPASPDSLYEQREVRDRVRAAMSGLPPRERHIVHMYYFGEATMKQIGEAIGVNESRVSQLHARAMQRLRKLLAAEPGAYAAPMAVAAKAVSRPRPRLARATLTTKSSRPHVAANVAFRPVPAMVETRQVA